MKASIAGMFFAATATVVASPTCPPQAIAVAMAQVDMSLPNACVPKAAAFLYRYVMDNPDERGELFFLELTKKGEEMAGHALGVFSYAEKIWIYDHELGVRATGISVQRFDPRTAKPRIGRIYNTWLRDTICGSKANQKNLLPPTNLDSKEHVLLACRMLGDQLKPVVVEIGDGGDYACVWDFVGYVWAYFPSRGASWVTPDGHKTYRELVAEVLRKVDILEAFALYKPERHELDRPLIAAASGRSSGHPADRKSLARE